MSEPAKVLFVDDEAQILAVIRRALAGSNLFVLTAQGGEAALEILRSCPVDVLVSDVDMPGMSGLELVRIARREYPSMLRIMLTGAATLELALDAINSGEVSRFFAKPFDVILFRETIAALAERINQQRSAQVTQARAARRKQLEAWVDERFPNAALGLARTGDEPVDVNLQWILRELEPAFPGFALLVGARVRGSEG